MIVIQNEGQVGGRCFYVFYVIRVNMCSPLTCVVEAGVAAVLAVEVCSDTAQEVGGHVIEAAFVFPHPFAPDGGCPRQS